MKHTKKRFEVFSFFDHDGISGHLEKMAAKGWMIEQPSNFCWMYHRIEPKKVKFAVSYYPKASEFDPEPTDEQKTFHEFCAHTGWKLACTSAQLQIFYNEQENPTPIETEPTLEVASIHASAKKSFIPSYIFLLLISFMNGGMFISGLLGDPIGQLASPTKLFTGFCFVLLATLCTVELICYFRWYTKAKKVAEQGEFLKSASTSKFQKTMLVITLLGLVYWFVNFVFSGDNLRRFIGILMCFYMPTLFILVNSMKSFLKRKKASRGVNRTLTMLTSFVLAFAMVGAITFGTLKLSQKGFFADKSEKTYDHNGMTWVIHQDDLPLTVEDLMEVDYDGYIKQRRGDESLLLGQFVMRQKPRLDAENYKDIPRMEYTMVFVKIPALYDICKDRLLYTKGSYSPNDAPIYEKSEAAAWGANEAYRLYDPDYGWENEYLLCYDDVLIEISFDWEPTPEQMQIVCEKLGTK